MALNNSQYDALMRVYQKRQRDDRHRQEERIAEVYRALPQMERYDREISALSVERAKKLLDGDERGAAQCMRQLEELREERAALFSMGGFPADYMEMDYTCPQCRDTGYVNGRKCRCFRQAEIRLLYGQSNLEEVLKRENFSAFTFDYYDKDLIVNEKKQISQYDYMKAVAEECRSYAAHFDESRRNLLFTGSTGTGKTFLTNCIAAELLERGEAVLYLTAPELFQIISDRRFERGGEETEEKYRGILECDLLIIDDLGTELNNSLENSELFYCVNDRALKGRAVIISTNLSMSELRSCYSERLCSRIISSYQIIQLFGEDIRIKKKIGRGARISTRRDEHAGRT